ncbi:MAG TPA: hypothetical protein VEA63_01855, partial [Opitutus sp.]|nr:hypothetical protein [Opitutus sp.]
MSEFDKADTLHRLVKQLIDSGAAKTVAEAEAIFAGFRVALVIADEAAKTSDGQIQLLTAIVLARRVFLGGVTVSGPLDQPLLAPLPYGDTLREAVCELGGKAGDAIDDLPTILIAGSVQPRRAGFCVRTLAAGWRGGIVAADADVEIEGATPMPLASMLAAALAINETFLHVSAAHSVAGRRQVGLSLWDPADVDWLIAPPVEPALAYLPSDLWLIGLGHLGQAYLWGLGLLPYAPVTKLKLVLQDIDIITPSTESTSVLSDAGLIGAKKTRAMAAWAEQRGFETAICERRFDAGFTRRDDEPGVALCGLDNALGRRALDSVGFDLIVEAGLGRGHRNFRTMRLHVLPGTRPAIEIWREREAPAAPATAPAYQDLLKRGELDKCGMALLAGKAVGAPFVGAV